MQTIIKTHVMKRTYHENHFFILSKGNNAGRPQNQPCPNCFVVITECAKEKQILFWLCYGLWQGGYFQRYLIGSVIPFLRLPELKSIIRETRSKVELNKVEFHHTVTALNRLLRCQQNLSKQLQIINQTKKNLISRFLAYR